MRHTDSLLSHVAEEAEASYRRRQLALAGPPGL